jgi:hypothetical protein
MAMSGDTKSDYVRRAPLWRRLFKRTTPEERVDAAMQAIEDVCQRAQRGLHQATREVEALENAQPPRSRRAPRLVRADAVIAQMERQIRELRSPVRLAPVDKTTDERRPERVTEAREKLDELEQDLADLGKRLKVSSESAAEWERRAMTAVSAGNDELAREALARKKEHDGWHRELSADFEHRRKVLGVLRELVEALEQHGSGDQAADPVAPKKG